MSMNYNHEYIIKVFSEISKYQIPLEGHVWCGVIDLDDEESSEQHPRYIPNQWFPK